MKIFLGYASEHLSEAREVYEFLKLRHDVWFDKTSLVGGDDWDRQRSEGQQSADLIIHLCSSEIVSRPGVVNREIRTSLRLAEDQPFGATFLLFVRLEEFRLPAELSNTLQYIDYFRAGWREELDKVLAKRDGQLRGEPPLPAGESLAVLGTQAPERRIVEFSDRTELYECVGDYPVYAGSEIYWTLVNSKIAAHALEGFVSTRHQMDLMASEDRERIKEYGTLYYWSMHSQEFYKGGDVLSVRFYMNTYMGGAHGNHAVTTLNFLGDPHGYVSIEELLLWELTAAKRILTYCRKVLEATFSTLPEGFLDQAFTDEANIWKLLAQYGIDAKGLTVNLSPYDVLPYAFGSHEILVPWAVVEEFIASSFKETIEIIRRPTNRAHFDF